MTLFNYIWSNIRFKSLTAIFNVLLLAIGIASILTLIHLNTQVENRFTKDLKGIDLVVSGKGSPLQIILANVFHLDIPTGNIPLAEADKLSKNPMIKQTIPLALGDNYNGYRIVGTNKDYITHYNGAFSTGRVFEKEMEAVLGSEVAKNHPLQLGDTIIGAHGLTGSDDLHSDSPYNIVGILQPTGTVLDRLVLTSVSSVWHVHRGHHHHHHHHKKHDNKEITALLISYKTPLAAVQLPRMINKNTTLQAASPAFEVARLTKMLGTGNDILYVFGIVLIAFAGFGFFVTLYNAIHERRYDIALMRSLGATKTKITSFIFAEIFILGICGLILGILITHLLLRMIAYWIYYTKQIVLDHVNVFNITDFYLGLIVLIGCLLAAIIPSIKAYRLPITKTLMQA